MSRRRQAARHVARGDPPFAEVIAEEAAPRLLLAKRYGVPPLRAPKLGLVVEGVIERVEGPSALASAGVGEAHREDIATRAVGTSARAYLNARVAGTNGHQAPPVRGGRGNRSPRSTAPRTSFRRTRRPEPAPPAEFARPRPMLRRNARATTQRHPLPRRGSRRSCLRAARHDRSRGASSGRRRAAAAPTPRRSTPRWRRGRRRAWRVRNSWANEGRRFLSRPTAHDTLVASRA